MSKKVVRQMDKTRHKVTSPRGLMRTNQLDTRFSRFVKEETSRQFQADKRDETTD